MFWLPKASLDLIPKGFILRFTLVWPNVSADKTDDERTGTSFYTVRIALLDADLEKSGISILVGMPIEVLLTLESRTFFSYLIKPLRKFFDHAIREKWYGSWIKFIK